MTLHFVPGKGFVDRDTGTLVKDIPTTRGARDYAKTQLKHKTKHAMLPSFTANWDAISKPTRTSCNEKEIDWTKIETQLQTQGYILEQRPQTILPLFTITAPEGHIIAEGKGLTTNDAKRSAIAEAVERIVAKIPPKQTAIGTQKDLDQELLDIDIGPRDLFTEETTTHWVPAHIVTRNQSGLLPAEYAHSACRVRALRPFATKHPPVRLPSHDRSLRRFLFRRRDAKRYPRGPRARRVLDRDALQARLSGHPRTRTRKRPSDSKDAQRTTKTTSQDRVQGHQPRLARTNRSRDDHR